MQTDTPFGAQAHGVQALDDRMVAARYAHPDDVIEDKSLSMDAKREILAGWISDAHAVADHPWLRQLESGFRVRVQDILDALRALDEDETSRRNSRKWAYPRRERRRGERRWSAPRSGDDDDPPSSPAGAMPLPEAGMGVAA